MNKERIIGIITIAVAIGVFAFFVISGRPVERQAPEENLMLDNQEMTSEELIEEETATTTPTTTTSDTVKKTTAPAPVKTTAPAPGAITQSYADALKIYSASGYRFQFVNCKATPGKLTIKQGTKFMLDNRDNTAHKIKVGSVNYNVGAYGFAIATAKTLGLNYITCDGGGAAQIQVEP
jgi:hypothetical protein